MFKLYLKSKVITSSSWLFIKSIGVILFLNLTIFAPIVVSQTTCTTTLNDGESISDAMTAAEAGDTICLEAGTYDGGFTIDKDDITLIGIDSAERSVISGGSMGIRISNSLNVRLEWLEIKDFSNFGIYGIGTSSAPTEGVEVHDNIVLGGGNTGVLMSNSTNRWAFTENLIEDNVSAIRLRGADNVVSNNQFVDNVIDIEFTAITNSTVTDNLLSNGIVFSASNFNHTITGNTFPNGDVLYFSTSEDNPTIPTNARQIIVLNATNLVITGFVLSDSVIPIQVSSSAGAHVHNNTIRNLADNTLNTTSSGAIRVGGSPNALVNNNILENNDVRAIHVTSSDGAEIYENQLTSNRQGIQVRQSDDVKVYGNTISDTNDTSRNRTGNGINVVSSLRIQITNNFISNSNEHGIHDSRLTSSGDAIIQGNTVTGSVRNGIAWVDSRDAVIDGNTVSSNGSGIEGPFDGTIINNIVTDNNIGIRARNNSLVEGNELQNNITGVNAVYSTVVNNNVITGHTGAGINIGQGDGQTVSNNQMSGNSVDVKFNSNENITVTDNEMETGVVLYSFYGEFAEYDHIITGNIVGGKPLVYIKGENNPIIPTNAGQIIVLNSTNVTISNFTFTNVASPVSILHSPGAYVNNLTIEGAGPTTMHNSALIEAVYSDSTIIENNSLVNGKRGVGLYRSEGVSINNNIINRSEVGSSYYGVFSKLSRSAKITDNEINVNGGTRGIEIDGTGHNAIISNNEVSNSGGDAVVVSIADSIQVEGNTITNGNGRGLYLSRAVDATIINNTITGHSSHGIDTNFNQNRSHRPFLQGNTISQNGGTGIRLDVEDLEMRGNVIEQNNIGAELTAPFISIGNTIQNNTSEGLRISGTGDENSDISQNNIAGNSTGLNFTGSGILPATQNWWGDPSGPSGGVQDPVSGTTANGSGDAVSSNVNFDPWLNSEAENAIFAYTSFSVSTESTFTGSILTASIEVENISNTVESYVIDFKVDNTVIESKTGELAQGDVESFKFYYEALEPGEIEIGINDLGPETVTVSPGWSQNLFSGSNFSTTEFNNGPTTSKVIEKWSTSSSEFPNSVIGNPVIVDGVIIYGRINGRVYAREAESSELIWERDLGGRFQTSPAVSGSQIIVVNNQGTLFSLNRSDGETQWTSDIGLSGSFTDNDVITSSPTIAEDVIYLSLYNLSGASFQARDLSNGNLLWSYDLGRQAVSTPAFSEGVVYVGSNDGKIYALDTSNDVTDRLIWDYETNSPFGRLSPIAYGDKLVFASGSFESESNMIHVVNRENGTPIWSENLVGFSPSTPTVANDVVYVGSQGATVYAFDINNGNPVWTFEPEYDSGTLTFTVTTPVVAGGILYIHSDGNQTPGRRFFGIDVETGVPIFDLSTPRIGAGPVVFNDVAYVGYTNIGVRAYFDDTSPGETTFAYNLLSVSSSEVYTGSILKVTAEVENTGDNLGEYEASLLIDGVEVNIESGELGVGDSETVTFYYQPTEPGSFEITIEDLDPAIVNVLPAWSQSNFGVNNNSETNFLAGPNTETIIEKWESPTQATVTGSPAIADGVIYYGMFDGSIYAADLETGDIIWETETGAVVRISPAVNDSLVFGGNGDGDIFALNRATGDILWRHNRGNSFVASPTLVDDVLYISIFNDDQKAFQALDIATGDELWSYDVGQSSASTPAFSNGVIYFGSNDQNLYALDTSKDIINPEDRLLWSFNTGSSLGGSYPVIDGNSIFIQSGSAFNSQNNLYSIDALTGIENWSKQLSGTSATNPAISDSLIFIGTEEGVFYALDKRDGQELWNYEPTVSFGTIFFRNSDPVVADGIVYAATGGNISSNRRFIGLAANTGEVLFEYDRIQNPNAGPVIFEGVAYVGYTNNGVRAYRSSVPEDFIADANKSTVTATPQHFADGIDASQVDVLILNEFGNPIEGLTQNDFEFSGGVDLSVESFEERFTAGTYRAFISSNTIQNINLTVSVGGVVLEERPSIEFLSIIGNWQRIEIEDENDRTLGNDVFAVSFIDKNIGYVLRGFEGDGFGSEASVIKTVDSGVSWETVYENTDTAFSDIFFVNENVGFISGPVLLKTENGGETWETIEPDSDVSFSYYGKMFFIDDSKGWLAGNRKLYITEDLGESWTESTLADSASGVRDIYFKNSDRGWMATSNGQLRDPGLIETSNGGVDWNIVIGENRLTGLDFGSENFGIALGRLSLQTEIYRTLDGGDNWILIEDDFDYHITKVSLIDEMRGWVVGNSGVVMSTEDAGQSWTREYPGTSDNFNFRDIQMIDENYGWAAGTNGVLLKYDAISGDPEPVVDAAESSVSATSPHLADGEDLSTVTFSIVSTDGDSLNGLIESDFEFNNLGQSVSIGQFSELASNGQYTFSVSSTEAQSLSLTATVRGVVLRDTVSILFEEPIIVDADQSIVTATSPHIADGRDESIVTITIISTQGDSLTGLSNNDFVISEADESVSFSEVEETETGGTYLLSITSTSAQQLPVSLTVLDVGLSDTVIVDFLEPIIVDADQSTVTATSPHVADGQDEALVTVTVITTQGDTLSGLDVSEFSRSISGPGILSSVSETDTPGIYSFTVASTDAQTVSVSVTVRDTLLTDNPQIEFTEPEVPVDPITLIDPDSSTVTASAPHIADGVDESQVTILLKNSNGNSISGIAPDDISVSVSTETATTGPVTELPGTGEYRVGITSTVRGEVTVSVTVGDLALTDQPAILFNPDPNVDPDSSSVIVSSPHFSSGQDSSLVTVELKNANGEEISGFSKDEFNITLSGSAVIADSIGETDTPGLYSFSVVSNISGESLVTIIAKEVELTDKPTILFEPPPEPVPDAPDFLSINQDGSSIILNWSVESEEFIGQYTIYRGNRVNTLTEFETVLSGTNSLTLADVPLGTAYYAITASNNDGEEGDQSNILSFVNDELTASSDWALSSIPLVDATIESALISAFSFATGYTLAENIEPNLGYWIKTKTFDTEIVSASGGGLDSTSINLREGWNLIGSISDAINVSDIEDNEGILTAAPVYTFSNNVYEESDQIIPGKGHWIFASDSGHISLTVYNEPPVSDELVSQSEAIAQLEIPKISFTTQSSSSEIFVSNIYLTEEEMHQFMMPPLSPEPKLDVRTSTDHKIVNNESVELVVQSSEYPVTVELSGMDENSEYAYRLTLEKEGSQRSVDLVVNQPNVITEEYDYIRIEQIHVDELITEHRLLPNYPNPFNPATTIHYQLREQTDVRIEVYDIIGRRVQTLANETQFSGEYRVSFDAASFASGVYIIRFMAGNYAEIRKMTLIK